MTFETGATCTRTLLDEGGSLKEDLIDRKPFGSDLNATSTETGIFTVLGVGVPNLYG